MEWLKAILEKAKIEDGKLDIDGVVVDCETLNFRVCSTEKCFHDKVTDLKRRQNLEEP